MLGRGALGAITAEADMVETSGCSYLYISHGFTWLVPADQWFGGQDFEMVCQVPCQHYDTTATQMEFQVSCILVA